MVDVIEKTSAVRVAGLGGNSLSSTFDVTVVGAIDVVLLRRTRDNLVLSLNC